MSVGPCFRSGLYYLTITLKGVFRARVSIYMTLSNLLKIAGLMMPLYGAFDLSTYGFS